MHCMAVKFRGEKVGLWLKIAPEVTHVKILCRSQNLFDHQYWSITLFLEQLSSFCKKILFPNVVHNHFLFI